MRSEIEHGREASWGELSFRRRMAQGDSADVGWSRFMLGVWLLLIGALIYPFYCYKVVTFLIERDVEEGLKPLSAQLDLSERQLEAQQARWAENVNAQHAANVARSMADRIRSVRVVGISDTPGRPLAIVDFGVANSTEIGSSICEQAPALFHRSMSGQIIHVQRYRGAQPALDAGTVGCPSP